MIVCAAVHSENVCLAAVLSEPSLLPYPCGAVMKNAVAAGEGVAVLAVAAADHPDHGNVPAQAVVEHGLVAGGDAGVGELQIAQGAVSYTHLTLPTKA